ncbi:MAG: phosphoribosylformylglycinamidine synthase subunit PurQ [Alphaproteobacteria bacterium]|nr:phosphoribosylformylglycinamidine synthase subunit PurQ [Alphaproteobacteria bacterium]
MKAAVIVFPGSNCDRDVKVALTQSMGAPPSMIWHRESDFPTVDLIVVPGGFSYGDYLRAGAIAANSPAMVETKRRAAAGVAVLGICNGFQILAETGLLPGVLMRNAGLRFICRDVHLRVERTAAPFTGKYRQGQVIRIPIAHADGNYFTEDDTLSRLEGEGQIAFRYAEPDGAVTEAANPNGSRANIAGIRNAAGNVLGMMPHPERLADPALSGTDGRPMFDGLVEALG